MRMKEILDEMQSIIDKLTDDTVKKVYVAACVTFAAEIVNKTNPNDSTIKLDFEQAYNDIKSFKLRNGL